MPVYFAYRSFDMGPTGKYLKRFEDDTVVDWFRRHWAHLAVADQEADERLTEVLGCDGWFLLNPFRLAATENMPPPQTHEQLMGLFERSLGDDFQFDSPHALQVFTEDDGEGGAVFYFDGHFLEQSGLAVYLLHTDWRLPSGHGDGQYIPPLPGNRFPQVGDGPGRTYAVFLARESKYPLTDLEGADRIDGVRLPELAQHLCRTSPESVGYLRFLPPLLLAGIELSDPMENALLRAIQAAPDDGLAWAAWSDWRQDRAGEAPGVSLLRGAFERLARFPGRRPEGLPQDADARVSCRRLIEIEERNRDAARAAPHSLIHVEEHLAQICLDVSWDDEPYFDQWIFFDDLWASAHPDLADALLVFAARWDVLPKP